MSWRDAPVYVEAHAVAVDVASRAPRWRADGHAALATRCVEAATRLLTAVSCALTFPADRADDLRAADRAVVALRGLLRVAADVGVLPRGALLALADRLALIGRMLGGWRRRLAGPGSPGGGPPASPGGGPPAATSA